MDAQATAKILRAFDSLPDPRRKSHRHQLMDLFAIALFAIISGCNGWVAVAEYGRSKLAWLKTFLTLRHGIPSHDTFGDVFARLNPGAFESCFQEWMKTLVQLSDGKLVAIDGKSLRRSFEHGWDRNSMPHMVSAFVQANHMVFAQVKTEGKGQELSAIEQLLEMLDLNGATVTIDALGCNRNIAGKIRDAGGDYLLQVKDNQPTLHAKLQVAFKDAMLDRFKDMSFDSYEQIDGDHGRIETRKLFVCWDIKPMLGELANDWPDLQALVAVQRTRAVGDHVSNEMHYYITSLSRRNKARRIFDVVRGHWSIENNLHWQLDVSFREDQRRVRKGHGAENFSRLSRLALNQLKNEQTRKVGIEIKRQICGWDNDYLLKVAFGKTCS